MKLDKRGQALVEFLLILPVLLLIIFAFLDFGRIILCKSHLESIMSDVILKEENHESIDDYLKGDKEYKISYKIKEEQDKIITLEVKLDLITPGLNKVLNNPYKVIVERRIINE